MIGLGRALATGANSHSAPRWASLGAGGRSECSGTAPSILGRLVIKNPSFPHDTHDDRPRNWSREH
eukprot:9313027-Lingulodinium_polyedra.AAC.1